MGTVKTVVAFFNTTLKRQIILKELSSNSKARWVERHEALIKCRDSLLPVVETLTKISQWQDQSTSSTANALLNTIYNTDFIIGLLLIDLLQKALESSSSVTYS